MANVVVVGTQWGDEGKGKIVDLCTQFASHIVRFQGGNNAGHTVIVGDKTYKLQFVYEDNESKAESATAAALKLITQNQIPWLHQYACTLDGYVDFDRFHAT